MFASLLTKLMGRPGKKNSYKNTAFLSLPVEGHGVDGVLVAVDDVDALPLGDVPHEDEVVVPGGQQDVLGRRVPLQVHDAPSARRKGECVNILHKYLMKCHFVRDFLLTCSSLS